MSLYFKRKHKLNGDPYPYRLGKYQNSRPDPIVLITGANRGIGREIALNLAKAGLTVVMGCRDIPRSESVRKAIIKESGNTGVHLLQIDLCSMKSIRAFTESFSQKYERLDVLINNAGVFSSIREETQDGLEKTMAVNYFGPFLLTNLLLPMLIWSDDARIITLASDSYKGGEIDLNDLNMKKSKYRGFKAYSNSKLAMILFTLELAERLKDRGISVNAVHPGSAPTGIWPDERWYFRLLTLLIKPFMVSVAEAAQTPVFLAISEEARGITGCYFRNMKIKEIKGKGKDPFLKKKLWEHTERIVGIN
ncbi:MAG: short-chain dehydrogenase [Spirochaetes bacterium]|nr:MAG: short-chain dehydrogenase [Spirochaetota bacterium]